MSWLKSFSRDEIRELREVSDLHGLAMVGTNWVLIGAALALVGWTSTGHWLGHALAIVFAVFLIGARQLGLAVVMHEAAHRTLFRSRWLNDWVGNWLAGYWIFLGVELYRPYHLQHHAHTGSERDPDIALRNGFPTTPASMTRKVIRDLTGIVGIKRLLGTFALLIKTLVSRPAETKPDVVAFIGTGFSRRDAARTIFGFFATQCALVVVLWALGHPWLFAVWAVAWLTTHNLVTRLRSIGEHAMTDLVDDPFRNTRTIYTRWWERLFIAPNGVAYHLEHHLLMTVPASNLPRLHRMLKERGLLEHAHIEDGYADLLRAAVSK